MCSAEDRAGELYEVTDPVHTAGESSRNKTNPLRMFDKSKNVNFATPNSKRDVSLTIDLLSLATHARGPQVLTYRPQFVRGVRIWTPFRGRNGELKGSGVSGTEGDNSQFRGASPKLTSNPDSPYLKPYITHFVVPDRIFGSIYRTEPVPGRNSNTCRSQNNVRLGKKTQKTLWIPRNVWSGVSGTGNPNMKLVLV